MRRIDFKNIGRFCLKTEDVIPNQRLTIPDAEAGSRAFLSSLLSNRTFFTLFKNYDGWLIIVLRFTRLKASKGCIRLISRLQKLAYGIQDEGYSLGIPQSIVYRRFQPPILTPFPCRSGRQTYRLPHVIILT